MRIASMRVVAAVVLASLAVTSLGPLAEAQEVVGAAESAPLEHAEQPMAPADPAAEPPAPPADPALAQAQPMPPAPPVMPAPPVPPAPATPPAPPTPPPASMQPAHPDLFQETLKAQQRGATARQALYETGAVVTNVFLIPGRAITCALGAGLGVAVLAITFGTGYKAAAGAFDEGCGGKWVVTGDDLKPEGSRAFEWER